MSRIFGTLIHSHLVNFDEDIKPAADMMTNATIDIYQRLISELLEARRRRLDEINDIWSTPSLRLRT